MLINLCEYIKQFNTLQLSSQKEIESDAKKNFFEEIMAENFQNLVKSTEFSDPIRLVNLRINTTPKHIIVKLL